MTWSPDLVTWYGTQPHPSNSTKSWIQLISKTPQPSGLGLHRQIHSQASSKISDRLALQLQLWRPSSLRKGLRSNISTKAVALEGATSYYLEAVTSYYTEDSTLYYAEDDTLYYAEVGISYYAGRYLVP